ncbi:MAG: MMPL family transporter, partial [Actinomycetota bacterium]|nr:MMPL family transporter [Actinomycetota bacterium]
MLVLPLPFIRSIGIGGMLIPAVSVLASITLLPAMLGLLGPRINSVRVLPRRLVEGSDVEAGFWNAWARFVVRRPIVTAATGLSIVAVLLFFGVQLNPSEAQAKDLPGGGDAINGRGALTAAGISAGVYKPFEILVEGFPTTGAVERIAEKVGSTPGVIGATGPPQWHTQNAALVEAIPANDGAAKAVRPVISNLQNDVLPALSAETGLRVTLGG